MRARATERAASARPLTAVTGGVADEPGHHTRFPSPSGSKATGILDDLQEQYPDDVVVVAVEADPSTAASEIYNSDLGDWTSVIDYHIMDDGHIS